MENNDLIKEYINTWYGYAKINVLEVSHLDEMELFEMALPGGLGKADEKSLEHLSLCPLCMDRLEEFIKVAGDESPDDFWEDSVLIGEGTLKAASDDSLEILKLKSRCGRFILSVFPSGREDSGTVVLKISSGVLDSYEGRMASVCDAAGNLIIQGVIREGALARKVTRVSEFDFKNWNAIITSFRDD